jgi:hypothetical protein
MFWPHGNRPTTRWTIFGSGLGEGPHVEQVGTGEPAHARKLCAQVRRQAANHPGTPSVALLALQDVPADPPVEPDQLGVDDERRAQPGLPDPGLQLAEPGVVAGRGVHRFERHGLILAQAHVAHFGDPDRPECRGSRRAGACPTSRWTRLRSPTPADPLDDRLQQPHRLADPVAQCRTVEIEPVPRINLALPMEWQMVAVLRHQQMCEHRRRGSTTRCRRRGRRGLSDRIARLAGIFWPDMPDHLEAARHIVQHLGHVLTELRHASTAVRTGACAIRFRLVDDLLPWQVVGQWLALRLHVLTYRLRPIFRRGPGDILSLSGLEFLKPQFELLDLPGDPFRRAAELHPS